MQGGLATHPIQKDAVKSAASRRCLTTHEEGIAREGLPQWRCDQLCQILRRIPSPRLTQPLPFPDECCRTHKMRRGGRISLLSAIPPHKVRGQTVSHGKAKTRC